MVDVGEWCGEGCEVEVLCWLVGWFLDKGVIFVYDVEIICVFIVWFNNFCIFCGD